MSSKAELLKLYKSLLRESQKIPSYNFRSYALRRIRDGFKENKNLTEKIAIEAEVKEAQNNLQIIKRQALIGQLYTTDKLVIENLKK